MVALCRLRSRPTRGTRQSFITGNVYAMIANFTDKNRCAVNFLETKRLNFFLPTGAESGYPEPTGLLVDPCIVVQ